MDLIVQKATELGCRTIVPVMSERTVVQCDDEEASSKQEKWQTVAVEAIKQCGQAWLPRVEKPVSLNVALSNQSPSAAPFSLIASLQPGAVHQLFENESSPMLQLTAKRIHLITELFFIIIIIRALPPQTSAMSDLR